MVLRNEDRLAEIRLSYHDERTSDSDRRRLTRECLTLQESLRATVEAKRAALEGFLADLDARIQKCRDLLASHPEPDAGQQDEEEPALLGGDRPRHRQPGRPARGADGRDHPRGAAQDRDHEQRRSREADRGQA